MKIFTEDNEIAVEIEWIRRRGENLIIWGKVLGTMRIKMYLSPYELCKGLKMAIGWGILSYLLLLPYFILKSGLSRLIKVKSQGSKSQRKF